jgi:hypothetical protein
MGAIDQMIRGAADAHTKADMVIELLADHDARLARLVEATEAANQRSNFRRYPQRQVAAAATETMRFDAMQGFGWNLVSIAGFTSVTAAGVEVRFYLGSAEPFNLIGTARPSDTGAWVTSFNEGEYVPQGGALVVEFVGVTIGNSVSANLKVEVLDEAPVG